MKLRTEHLSAAEFQQKALELKLEIKTSVHSPAQHPGIQKIQNIFREQPTRLYHWATAPTVPADNNRAERELRPLVIARKISFGSQSEQGAQTREILMSVLHTLRKRTNDVFGVCGVEEWRGGVKVGRSCFRPFRLPVPEEPTIRSVSTPRSSNRTCPFQASGIRSRVFMLSHTSGCRSWAPVVASPSPGADTGARGASHSRPDSAVCHSTTDAADAVRGYPPPGKLG
jgi:hypothetical protein